MVDHGLQFLDPIEANLFAFHFLIIQNEKRRNDLDMHDLRDVCIH
jgi:hypothetical protein